MKAYRWEHKETGAGPIWVSGYPLTDLFATHEEPYHYPCWVEFIIKTHTPERDYFFGWTTEELFDEFLLEPEENVPILEQHGYEKVVYEVTEDFIVLPDGQIAFNKSKATKIDQ